MEKVMKLILVAFGFCLFLAGCSRITTDRETSSPSPEAISPSTIPSKIPDVIDVSDSLSKESPTPRPNTNPDDINKLPDYSLEELFDFYLSGDGAYSEGAMAEMIQRFVVDSNNFLIALSKLDDDNKMSIANDLGTNMKVWGGSEYEGNLKKAESSELDKQQKELLDTIREAFDTAKY